MDWRCAARYHLAMTTKRLTAEAGLEESLNMRFGSVLLGLFALALNFAFALPAHAQEQRLPEEARPQVVTQFDELTIRFLLQDIQARWELEQGPDGQRIYRASAEDGLNFSMVQSDCTAEGFCTSLMLIAIYNGTEGISPQSLDLFINAYNDSNPSAKLMRNPQGVVAMQAYINASFGISYRNLQAQVLVFGDNIVDASAALGQLSQAQ